MKSFVAAVAIALVAIGVAAASRDVTSLATQATNRVHSHAEFRKAVLVGVDGRPATHHAVKDARDIIKWRFTYNNTASGSKYANVTITSVRGNFGKPAGGAGAIMDASPIHRIRMTLRHAVKLLRGAGFTKGFYEVSLGKVLTRTAQHTKYYFVFAGRKTVSVDTVSGKVKALNSSNSRGTAPAP